MSLYECHRPVTVNFFTFVFESLKCFTFVEDLQWSLKEPTNIGLDYTLMHLLHFTIYPILGSVVVIFLSYGLCNNQAK